MADTLHDDVERTIHAYGNGRLSRRAFLERALGLGLTVGQAGALATIFSTRAWATPASASDSADPEYDYIVIGAGSAGAALVNRLCALGDARILVLEAGGPDDIPEIHDPRLWQKALNTRAAKWFSTTAQAHTANRIHVWPRGNVLGGSSSLNLMIYARGHRSDFDSWAAAGCTGWDYESVLPAFRALEDFEGGASRYRGVGGPLHVSMPRGDQRHPHAQLFIDSAAALGYAPTADFNSERMEGPAWVNFTIKDHHRQSTAVAFLKPVLDRRNLTVLTDAPVNRLTIEHGRCVGVEYLHAGKLRKVRATQEVALCAGALDSPRLLLLSGIGDAAALEALGIAPHANLKGVGRNLQDHVLACGPTYEAPDPVPPSRYNASEAYMWARSSHDLAGPDMAVAHFSVPIVSPGCPIEPPVHGWSVLGGLMRPTSTGSLKLASADPHTPPVIDPNYLATEHDRRVLSEANALAREIAASPDYAPVRRREVLPGPSVKPGSDAWQAFLANAACTFFHPTSTCKMGVDETSVVDPQLRVYGIDGLRVADASIMPAVTSSNTNAASIMIGWKCAELMAAATRRSVS